MTFHIDLGAEARLLPEGTLIYLDLRSPPRALQRVITAAPGWKSHYVRPSGLAPTSLNTHTRLGVLSVL